jgi:hypothetical protein
MKNVLFYASLALVFLCAFVPSTDKTPPASLQEVHERLVAGFMMSGEEYTLDKSISMKQSLYEGEPETELYPTDHCASTVGTLYGMFQAAIDEKAGYSWYDWYGTTYFNNNKRLLGGNLIKKRTETKTGTKFNHFDPIVIEKAFQGIYKKPTEKFKGIATYQKIYNATVKKLASETAAFIADVMANKKGLDEVSAIYKKSMETSEEFYGGALPEKCYEKIFDKSKLQQDGDMFYYPDKSCGYAQDILLIMVRRNIDGTLPTLLKLFKQVLQDYDAPTFEKYKNKF